MNTQITNIVLHEKGLQEYCNEESWFETSGLKLLYSDETEKWQVIRLSPGPHELIATIDYWEEFLDIYRMETGRDFHPATPKDTLYRSPSETEWHTWQAE